MGKRIESRVNQTQPDPLAERSQVSNSEMPRTLQCANMDAFTGKLPVKWLVMHGRMLATDLQHRPIDFNLPTSLLLAS